MTEEKIYDLVVIGAGPGGYHAALRAAQYGAKVAIIEKSKLGGTCSNWGCIPTKALFASAKMLGDLKEKGEEFGILISGSVKGSFVKAVERKNKVVSELVSGIEGLLKTRKIAIFVGTGKVEGGNATSGFTVSSTAGDGSKTMVKGKRVIVATGSTPALIPAFNIDHSRVLTSDDILAPEFNRIPRKMLIIGAGVIGCEFANIFATFGVQVELLEFLPTMLATEEKAVIRELKKKFDALGIKVHTSQMVQNVENTGVGVKATTIPAGTPRDQADSAEKTTFEADICLVSIGRSKVSSNLGLEELGVKIERGQIAVNRDNCETDVEGLYAIGDVTGGLMLAHVASYEGDIAVENALSSIGGFDVHPRIAKYDVVPYTIFTSPNIGSVGLREKAAKEKHKVYTGRFFYGSLGKAKCMGEDEGFMMIVAEAATGKILGATCIGAEAPELISEVTVAMNHGITAQGLGEVIHSHPTISEMVLECAEDVHGMAIHKVGRRKAH
ncbi:MAG: dihydrolipoyl dehydrogenase [Promethearchaeota archaeon]